MVGYTNIVKMESLDSSSYSRQGDQFLEYHEQDLGSEGTITTQFDVVIGGIPIQNSSSAATTILTDCAVTTTLGVKTIEATGTATAFFLVGQFSAVEG
jgi:hypothetical protein